MYIESCLEFAGGARRILSTVSLTSELTRSEQNTASLGLSRSPYSQYRYAALPLLFDAMWSILPVMTMNSNALYKGLDRSFCVRMKSTLTKRGCHFKSSGYRHYKEYIRSTLHRNINSLDENHLLSTLTVNICNLKDGYNSINSVLQFNVMSTRMRCPVSGDTD
ncbi:hypothetical protein TNIN_329281 [Trichonephila inaurata madagascariensis]|uniref:Uncharacterized protein n=1 Tax=Trichonephila inaurata madagascariensis TaxID=2747483 RepID=A0A8X7BRC1_9ARAC|nr:hypothetical protein TNIN_329281 [Trichonephila inaurata madagascariensis]